jgi:alkanesulfonate monooxygenase SsuD/methylene tetrahydromethanopterin reductase-like flavin-dependent oxidoreductase (luciferase family)
MKLLFFHLMPYRELPDTFREEHRSVWVDIDSKLFDPLAGESMYRDYLDELEFAAARGFDGVCVNEHHSNAYGLMPSPNLMAAILARNTVDAAVVVLGNSLALYNPPIRVAEEMAMLDVISGGRLVAGFPVGTPMDTCHAYGIDPSTLRARYLEAHDLIVKAWTSDEAFAWNGRFTKLRTVNPWPRPRQRPHPPIWIPGGGSVDSWEWCARQRYVYSYLSYFGYRAGQATMDGYWAKMAELGQEPNPFRAGFLQFVGVADSDAEAEEIYGPAAEYFFNRCLHVYPGFADAPGYKTEDTIRARAVSQLEMAARGPAKSSGTAAAKESGLSARSINERGFVVLGSPTTVAERLAEVGRSLNVGHLMLLLQFGNMETELVRNNIDLFTRYVAPEISGLFENEWEDEWWPAGCPDGPRIAPAANQSVA